jgi:hypothetical protein
VTAIAILCGVLLLKQSLIDGYSVIDKGFQQSSLYLGLCPECFEL